MPVTSIPAPGMGKEKSSIGSGFSVSGSFSAVMVASSSSFALKVEGAAEKVRSWSEKCSTCRDGVSTHTALRLLRALM